MNDVGEGADVFADVDGGHEAVAVGDEVDAFVFGGGDGQVVPGVEARVVGDGFGFVEGADQQDIGGEGDDGFAAGFDEAIAGGGAGVNGAGGGDHFVDKGFSAGDEHEFGADEVEDFGVRRVLVFGGDGG